MSPKTEYTPQDYARQQVSKDPVARLMGIELEELNPEKTVVSLIPKPHHLNSMGTVHGTTMYAMLDQAAAIACNAFDYRAILCQGKIDFLNTGNARSKLLATATPLSIKRRLSIWEVKITDDRGVLLAAGQAMAYHFV